MPACVLGSPASQDSASERFFSVLMASVWAQTSHMLRFTPQLARDAGNFRMPEEEKGVEISMCWAAEA